MSKLKIDVDFSSFWNDDETLSKTIERLVIDECEAEVRRHIKALLIERRSQTAKQVAAAMKSQLERLASKLSA